MCETVFTRFSHDNTPYVSGDSENAIIKSLKDDFINVFKWFLDNEMYLKCKNVFMKNY